MSLSRVDHLVYAAPDLERGVARLASVLGVRAAPGGRHPAWGTRNALLSLGRRTYVEVLAPDPERGDAEAPTAFGFERLGGPRLALWAARSEDLETEVRQAAERGVRLGPVQSGERETPRGNTLSWRLTDPTTVLGDGLVPFLIAWGGTEHPSSDAPGAGRLVELRAEHPEPDRVTEMLRALDLDLVVARASAPALIAGLETARGVVELR